MLTGLASPSLQEGDLSISRRARARHPSPSLPHPLLPDLTSVAAKAAADQGFELADLQMLTHLRPMTVQIQIRHTSGDDVTLDDCAGLSLPMGEAIEASTLLTEAYVLEISSPGIGDLLQSDRDFQTFRGFPVDVIFLDNEGQQQTLAGSLLERTGDHLEVNIKGRIKRIPRSSIRSVQLTSPTS